MDEAILLALNGLRRPALDAGASWLSEWGLFAFLVALAWRAGITRTRADLSAMRGGWLAFFVALFVSDTCIKPLVGRARPTTVEALAAQLHVLGTRPPATSLSFPSGTAAACAAAATWIALRFGPRAGIVAAIYAVLVSITRVYAGLHWPSDLIGGWVVGAAVAMAIARLDAAIDRA